MVQRLAEIEHIGFRRAVVGHVRQSVGGAECRDQQHGAATALDEPAAKAMDEFEMGGAVEGETTMEVREVLIQEPARAGGAGVGDQQPDIKTGCCGNKVCCAAGVSEIDGDDAIRDVVVGAQRAASSCNRSVDRSANTTLSPSEAQRSAKARPIPDEAPVMSAHGP